MPETAEIHSAIPDLPIRVLSSSFPIPMPPHSKEPQRFKVEETIEFSVMMQGFFNQQQELQTRMVMGDSAHGVILKLCVERYNSLRAQLTQVAKERDEFAKLWDDVCHERDDLKAELGKRKGK